MVSLFQSTSKGMTALYQQSSLLPYVKFTRLGSASKKSRYHCQPKCINAYFVSLSYQTKKGVKTLTNGCKKWGIAISANISATDNRPQNGRVKTVEIATPQ